MRNLRGLLKSVYKPEPAPPVFREGLLRRLIKSTTRRMDKKTEK